MQHAPVVGTLLKHGAEDVGGFICQVGSEQELAEGFEVFNGEAVGVELLVGVVGDQVLAGGGGVVRFETVEEQRRERPPGAWVFGVEADDDVELRDGFVELLVLAGEPAELEVCFGVVRLEFEDAPELLSGLGGASHLADEASDVEEGRDVARVLAQGAEVELAGALEASGGGVGVGEPRVHAGECGVETGRLTQAPDGLVVQPPNEQGVGQHRVREGVLGVDLLGHVEHDLGLFVLAEAGEGLDPVDVRGGALRLELLGPGEPLDRLAEQILLHMGDGDEHDRLELLGLQLVRLVEGVEGLGEASRGGERHAEIGVPVRAVRVEREGLSQGGLGLVPAPGLEELVGPLYVMFRVAPVVHDRPWRLGRVAWSWGPGVANARAIVEVGTESTRFYSGGGPPFHPSLARIRLSKDAMTRTRACSRLLLPLLIGLGVLGPLASGQAEPDPVPAGMPGSEGSSGGVSASSGQPTDASTDEPPTAAAPPTPEAAPDTAETPLAVRTIERWLERDDIASIEEATDAAALPAGRRTTLATLAERTRLAPELLPVLRGVLRETDDDEDWHLTVRAISAIRTTKSVRVLLDLAGETSGIRHDHAVAGLGRLTGRSFGHDLDAWSGWFEGVEYLSDGDWAIELAAGLADEADRQAAAASEATRHLVTQYRRAFRSIDPTDIDARSATLAELLGSPFDAVRRLGTSLAIDELANGRMPTDPVHDAALAMLEDPAPAFRRDAARLVRRLAPAGAGDAIYAALVRERDPTVASVMLQASTRWPLAIGRPMVLAWLEGPAESTWGPALEAVEALEGAGLLEDAGSRARVRDAIRRRDALTPRGIELLVTFGTGADRARVATLLANEMPGVRRAAAESLARDPGMLGPIVQATAQDPNLFNAASRAIRQHRPDAWGYATLFGLPANDDRAKADALVQLRELLLPDDLVWAALSMPSPTIREPLLMRLVQHELLGEPALVSGTAPGGSPVTAYGLLALAECGLALERPDGMLEALDAIERLNLTADRQHTASLRVIALLWLDRVDEAERIEAPVAAWVEGAERAATQPHGPSLVGEIESRFGDVMSETDAARLARLKARIAEEAQSDPSAETATAGADPDQD